jgi:hypothetical protein
MHLLGRNSLVRRTDQAEALLIILAVVVNVLAVPYTSNMRGTFYAAHIRTIEEDHATDQTVDAVAVAHSVPIVGRQVGALTVRARWVADATTRTGTIRTGKIVKAGDHLKMWIDAAGNPTAAPEDSSQARTDAVVAAFVLWLVIAALCAGVLLLSRIAFGCQRRRQWDRELAQLVGGNDGWADRRR